MLERETLHVMDDQHRIALVETRTIDTSGHDPGAHRSSPNTNTTTTWISRPRTRRRSENHLLRGMRALRHLTFQATATETAQSATGTPERNATKKPASTTTALGTTPLAGALAECRSRGARQRPQIVRLHPRQPAQVHRPSRNPVRPVGGDLPTVNGQTGATLDLSMNPGFRATAFSGSTRFRSI